MAELALAFEVYLDAIGEEADRLAAAASEYLEKAVASCPDWNGADLVTHVANVYRRWTAQVLARHPDERILIDSITWDESAAIMAGFEEATTHLLEVLRSAGAESPCWNLTGEDLDCGWVARRVAHESAIHRVDAEQIGRHPTRIDTEFAVDGLSERISVLSQRIAGRAMDLGGSLGFVCDDAEAAFVVEVNDGDLRYRSQRAPADCVVVGPASALYLFSWNRLAPSALSVTGDEKIAAAWSTISPG